MPKKGKTGRYKGPKRTYIVHHKHGILPIEEFGDIKKMMQYKPKPTLHAGGGLAQRGLGKAFMKGGKV